jgi:hypothetical protein
MFRYIGEYPDGMGSVRCFDVAFTPGAEVEVPDRCVEKARGNRFFEEVTGKAKPTVKAEPKPAETEFDPLEGMDRDSLIALAELRGIKIDKRWNDEKITSAIKDSVNGE